MRSDVVVDALLWYCDTVHTVRAEQTRFDVVVAGADSYWVELHVVSWLHTRSEVVVTALL